MASKAENPQEISRRKFLINTSIAFLGGLTTYWAYSPDNSPEQTRLDEITQRQQALEKDLKDSGTIVPTTGLGNLLVSPDSPKVAEYVTLETEKSQIFSQQRKKDQFNLRGIKAISTMLGPFAVIGSLSKLLPSTNPSERT